MPTAALRLLIHNATLRRSTVSIIGSTSSWCCGGAALRCATAGIKSRSLSPDDPFGEQGSFEDPSDGIYAPWKHVDQDGFIAASESDEVRQAHFGPEWARFTTVGRLSVKKMKEQRSQPNTNSGASPSPSPTAVAEAAHQARLTRSRELFQRNYDSYEAYAAAELGVLPDGPDGAPTSPPPQEHQQQARHATEENAVEDADEEGEEVAQSAESVPLPNFFVELSREASSSTSASTSAIPPWLHSQLGDALGAPHGDASLPWCDPLQWSTADIVRFLELFEHVEEGGTPVMDASMAEAFATAEVNGDVLLHVVTPPRLFSLMRRWHSRRQSLAADVWRLHQQAITATTSTSSSTAAPCRVSEELLHKVVPDGRAKLEAVVRPLNHLLIQETALLCYPYGR